MPQVKLVIACVVFSFLAGCSGSKGADAPTEEKKAKTGIFGKKTQEIGKFDPAADQEVSDQKIHATDPITGPLMAYGPLMEKVSIIAVDQAVALFNATEGRYPKDYDEFMSRIIKENNIQLPVLPFGDKYQYNEKDHVLVIIKGKKKDADGKDDKSK